MRLKLKLMDTARRFESSLGLSVPGNLVGSRPMYSRGGADKTQICAASLSIAVLDESNALHICTGVTGSNPVGTSKICGPVPQRKRTGSKASTQGLNVVVEVARQIYAGGRGLDTSPAPHLTYVVRGRRSWERANGNVGPVKCLRTFERWSSIERRPLTTQTFTLPN